MIANPFIIASAVLRYGEEACASLAYFVQAGTDGLIKIGHARDIGSRMCELQTGCPNELTLLAVEPGGRDTERRLHARFLEYRIRGEWFSPNPEILEYVSSLNEQRR
jgi:hypothetical protein